MEQSKTLAQSFNEQRLKFVNAYDESLNLWPVSYQTLFIPTRFGLAHVIASGPKDAPPILLLHGSLYSSIMWYPNIEELSRYYRVYALDIINDSNKTEPNESCVTRQDFANWFIDVLDGINIQKTRIVGLSYGGVQTLNLLINYPERVEKAIIVAPAEGFISFNPEFFEYAYGMFEPNGLQKQLKWMTNDRFSLDPLLIKQYQAAIDCLRISPPSPADKDGLPCVFTDEELESITVSTLLLIGEYEVLFNPLEALKRASKLMKNVEAELIEGVGHVLTMEKPEVFNKRVLNFFNN